MSLKESTSGSKAALGHEYHPRDERQKIALKMCLMPQADSGKKELTVTGLLPSLWAALH